MFKILLALLIGFVIVHFELWESLLNVVMYIIIGLFLIFIYNLTKDFIKDLRL